MLLTVAKPHSTQLCKLFQSFFFSHNSCVFKRLLIFSELILLAQCLLLISRKRSEISFPARTEINMPTPKTTHQRVWFLIVISAQFAMFTLMCQTFIISLMHL